MSFLSSLINIFTEFAMQIVSGFVYQPATKLRSGSIFSDMTTAINYVDQNGKYFLGQPYGSTSIVARPSFEQAPTYQPGNTTPPRTYPTSQPNGYQVPLGVNDVGQYQFSAEALRHLRAFEGLHQRAYVINGQAYIGYGSKLEKYDPNLYVSIDQAEQMLQADISSAEALVKGAISVKITQGQYDALVDFAFTVSPSKFKNSTVVQKINAGDVPGASTALVQYVYSTQNGVVAKVPHLVSRRTANVQWMTMPVDPAPIS